jgi:hypothetical protein
MPIKLSTLVSSIDNSVPNQTNANLIKDFYQFVKDNGTSESYQKNNLKAIINFARFLGPGSVLMISKERNRLLHFLTVK